MKSESIHDEEAGAIWALNQIHWQFFVTIALPHVPGVGRRAWPIWQGFHGRLARELRIPKCRHLIWAVSLEWGTSGINPHLHAIISGLPRELQPTILIRAMETIGLDMGIEDVVARTYDDRPGAVSYLFKEFRKPDERRGSPDGRWPRISESVWVVLQRHPNRRSGTPGKGRANA